MDNKRHLKVAFWLIPIATAIIPIAMATFSPFLDYRDWIYIMAGFAGIITLALFIFQPLLAINALPFVNAIKARKLHRFISILVLVGVFLHIFGLYLTSPPDTLDALLLVSPTPFSLYGVIAMWALVAIMLLALTRKKFVKNQNIWKYIHSIASTILIIATIIHALQIQGAMEPISKWILCLAVFTISIFSTIYLWRFKIKR